MDSNVLFAMKGFQNVFFGFSVERPGSDSNSNSQ